jgi:hypothetical protein
MTGEPFNDLLALACCVIVGIFAAVAVCSNERRRDP